MQKYCPTMNGNHDSLAIFRSPASSLQPVRSRATGMELAIYPRSPSLFLCKYGIINHNLYTKHTQSLYSAWDAIVRKQFSWIVLVKTHFFPLKKKKEKRWYRVRLLKDDTFVVSKPFSQLPTIKLYG